MPNEAILIVEDDPVMLRGLKDNFTFKGYRRLRNQAVQYSGIAGARECFPEAPSAGRDTSIQVRRLHTQSGFPAIAAPRKRNRANAKGIQFARFVCEANRMRVDPR